MQSAEKQSNICPDLQLQGAVIRYKKGPSKRYIGPNLRDFFYKRPAIRYIFIPKFSKREIVYKNESLGLEIT